VPDALDRAFTMTDKGLEQADIMFPGATCIVAFVHLEDKVSRLLHACYCWRRFLRTACPIGGVARCFRRLASDAVHCQRRRCAGRA